MEEKRRGKLLSGEEIINAKNNSLKDVPSGCKDYAPNNSWLEQKQIQATLETYHNLVGSERVERRSNLSTALWVHDVKKAKVTKKTGKHWEVFGHSINSEDWLYPEETLFLLETNALELYSDETPLSVEQTYSLVIGECCTLQEYRVYSHLSKKGYRILRHDKEITCTSYERDIRLNQLAFAQKRSFEASLTKATDTIADTDPQIVAVDENGVREVSVKSNANGCDFNKDTVSGIELRELQKAAMPSESDESSSLVSKIVQIEERIDENSALVPKLTLIEEQSVSDEPVSCGECSAVAPKAALTDEQSTSNEPEPVSSDVCSAVIPEVFPSEEQIISSEQPSCSDDSSSMVPEVTRIEEQKTSEKPESSEISSDAKETQTPNVSLEEQGASMPEKCSEDGNNSLIAEAAAFGSPEVSEATVIGGCSSDVSKSLSSVVEFDLVNTKDYDEIECKIVSDDDSVHMELECPKVQSPDLVVVEDKADEIIEINDDDDEANDTDDFEITEIRSTDHVISVNLVDSDDEEDDVIFVCHKTSNNDPSKWRKWFASVSEFTKYVPPEEPEQFDKSAKIKLIDCFDLANKRIDTIMKAIPSHNGTENFINSPDQRFIPSTILPQYSQYRISLNTSTDQRLTDSAECTSRGHVDTSQSLCEIVGQDRYHSNRSSYGYHRTRSHNFQPRYPRLPWKPFYRGHNNSHTSYSQPNFFNNSSENNHNSFNNHNSVNNHNSFNNQNPSNQNWNHTPSNFHNSFRGGHFSNSMSNPNGNSSPLNLALQQVQQMQMLAFSLMQSSQALIQQCSNPNQMGVFNGALNNSMANFPPVNSYTDFNRGHRSYRRPYRRWYKGPRYNNHGNHNYSSERSQRVTEVVTIDDEDDKDLKTNPTMKRVFALGAIVELNSAKRPKVNEIETAVKREKPVKIESSRAVTKDRPQLKVIEIQRENVERLEDTSSNVSCDMDVVEVMPDTPPVDTRQTPPVASLNSNDPHEVVSLDSDSEHSNSLLIKTAMEDVEFNPSDSAKLIQDDVGNRTNEFMEVGETEEMESLGPNTWQTYKMSNPVPEAEKDFRTILNYDDQRASISDVLKALQIFKPIEDTQLLRSKIKVSFDLYLPNQPFRKSMQMVPNYRVVVSGIMSFPTILELNYLQSTYKDEVPFLYAVVCEDSIRFYHLHAVSLPTFDEDPCASF